MIVATKAGRASRCDIERDGRRLAEAADAGRHQQVRHRRHRRRGRSLHPADRVGLNPGEAAEAAGLRAGDVILARRRRAERQLRAAASSSSRRNRDRPLPLEIRRDGVSPADHRDAAEKSDGTCASARVIDGIELRRADPSPSRAVKLSAVQNWEWTKLILKTLKGLFTRETPMNQLMGPVGIAEMSGSAAQPRLARSCSRCMAMISLNLGLAEPDADPGARRRPHPDPRRSRVSRAATSP